MELTKMPKRQMSCWLFQLVEEGCGWLAEKRSVSTWYSYRSFYQASALIYFISGYQFMADDGHKGMGIKSFSDVDALLSIPEQLKFLIILTRYLRSRAPNKPPLIASQKTILAHSLIWKAIIRSSPLAPRSLLSKCSVTRITLAHNLPSLPTLLLNAATCWWWWWSNQYTIARVYRMKDVVVPQ